MKYKVEKLTDNHLDKLEIFCNECDLAGYNNNNSLEAIKWGQQYDLQSIPEYWGIFDNNKLITLSGCHVWDDDFTKQKAMRLLFRSATLPGYENIVPVLSKTHMNSTPFSVLMPLQIKYGMSIGIETYFITTSHGKHDASGKMNRTHRALELLAKQSIVDYYGIHRVYYTSQTVWKLNLEKYFVALKTFEPTKNQLFNIVLE